MKILLIQPSYEYHSNFFKNLTFPSLSLQQLAAIVPPEHDLRCIDENFEKIDFTENYDLVGISCITSNSCRGYKIAEVYRKQGTLVIIGGYHPSALPEEAKQHADSVLIGEAELSLPLLLRDLENHNLKPFYRSKPVDPALIPPANREAVKSRFPVTVVEATRGCPNRCEFCSIPRMEGRSSFRARPVENVINEIKNIKTKSLFFSDHSFTISPKYTKALFTELAKLDRTFHCYGNLDVLGNDDELLSIARKAGCKAWFCGFESVYQDKINKIGKRTNTVESYKNTVRKIHDHGMAVIGSFAFGFDDDKPDVFDQTLDSVFNIEIDLCVFLILTPFPNTPLFDRLENEGRILTKDWSKYTETNVVFKPRNMTPEELLKGTIRISKNFNSNMNILKRMVSYKKPDFQPFIWAIQQSFFSKFEKTDQEIAKKDNDL